MSMPSAGKAEEREEDQQHQRQRPEELDDHTARHAGATTASESRPTARMSPRSEREHEGDAAGAQRRAEPAQQDPLHAGAGERLPEDLAELARLLEPLQHDDDERDEHAARR